MIHIQTLGSNLIPLYNLGIVRNVSAQIERPGPEKTRSLKMKKIKVEFLEGSKKKQSRDFQFKKIRSNANKNTLAEYFRSFGS